jgi:Spy/CpxP family protein refolding chaperone
MKGFVMRTRSLLVVAGIGLYVMLAALPAAAHHAFGVMYDANRPVKLSGAVAKIELINPHSWIYLDVRKNDGKVEQWTIEAGGAATLQTHGFTKDSVKVGTEVVVDGYQSKDGALRVHGRELTLPSGQPLFIGSTGSGAPYDTANVPQGDRMVVRTQVAGAWWTNAAVLQRLGLTDDQKTKIERTFENHRLAIVSTTSNLEKEEAQLERLLAADPADRNAVFTQIDRVIQARSEMERESALMTFEMREHLTRNQWLQLPRTNLTIRTPATPPVAGQRRGQ